MPPETSPTAQASQPGTSKLPWYRLLGLEVAMNWRRDRKSVHAAAVNADGGRLFQGIGVETPIHQASEDLLRRTDFANRLATILAEPNRRDGRVFAIRGGWGFGKSSLKNLIVETLNTTHRGITVLDFNPWQWGDSDAIATALFDEMADLLGGDDSRKSKRRATALRRYGALLTGAGGPLKDEAGVTRVITPILTNLSLAGLATAYGFTLPQVAKVAGFLAALALVSIGSGKVLAHLGRDRSAGSLDVLRGNVKKRLLELKLPLVVFVDDIDRLEPEQIRLLLRTVKANANLPNVTFVLLFQASIVQHALDLIADGEGRAFLEKIVQTSFDLPAVAPSVVHRLFGQELTQIAGAYATEENGFSQRRWGNVMIGCIQPMVRNMRDAKRLASSIAVHLPLHGTARAFEVNIIDFLLLEALRVFESPVHEALFRERELVLQESRLGHNAQREADKESVTKLVELVPEARRAIVTSALKELFPRIEWALGGMNYGDGFHERWMTEKRICTSRYFPQYFELQSALGELSERDFVAFLDATADPAQLAEAVAGLESHGLLPSLVTRLDESVNRLPVANAAIVLPALFRLAEHFAGAPAPDPFRSPWLSAWRATSWYVKGISERLRGELALDALRQTRALSVASMLISLSDPANVDEKNAGTFEPSFDAATLAALKALWLEIIRERAADSGALLAEQDLIMQLYRWRHYAGAFDEPKAWVADAIASDEGFAVIVSRMMSQGTSHGAGDRVSVVENHFNRETVDEFIGVEVAKARLDAIDPAQYGDHEQALDTLKKYVAHWLGERDESLFGL